MEAIIGSAKWLINYKQTKTNTQVCYFFKFTECPILQFHPLFFSKKHSTSPPPLMFSLLKPGWGVGAMAFWLWLCVCVSVPLCVRVWLCAAASVRCTFVSGCVWVSVCYECVSCQWCTACVFCQWWRTVCVCFCACACLCVGSFCPKNIDSILFWLAVGHEKIEKSKTI